MDGDQDWILFVRVTEWFMMSEGKLWRDEQDFRLRFEIHHRQDLKNFRFTQFRIQPRDYNFFGWSSARQGNPKQTQGIEVIERDG